MTPEERAIWFGPVTPLPEHADITDVARYAIEACIAYQTAMITWSMDNDPDTAMELLRHTFNETAETINMICHKVNTSLMVKEAEAHANGE